ncbi:hypothetical protein PG2000B_1790 [Bifidobacterium pseudolongum subsp. globosum]|uniref:hypothetical protein n=1 Tax=Bifidobacterium pseudolongum TaxID=1694 RepID=UPI00102056E5|nr:hypothetical protein [Bifidobacterium pseudolongum]RYQ39955.1 hypothetical protein PG2000B_1790 [Bifidobacterium pseudolongum subsp. globosum]
MSLTVTSIRINVPDVPTLTPVLDRYVMGDRPAVMLYDLAEEELWSDLTVNLDDALPQGCAFVPYDQRVYLDALVQQGYTTVIGDTSYGNFGQRAYIVRLAPELIAKEA